MLGPRFRGDERVVAPTHSVGRRDARDRARHLGLVGEFAAPIAAEGYRPGADAVLAPRRRKAPAVSDRLFRARLGALGRVIMPPPAAGADEFTSRRHGSRSFSCPVRHSTTIWLQRSTLVSDAFGRRRALADRSLGAAPGDAPGPHVRGLHGRANTDNVSSTISR